MAIIGVALFPAVYISFVIICFADVTVQTGRLDILLRSIGFAIPSAAVAAMILSIAAYMRIRNAAGRLRGLALAVIGIPLNVIFLGLAMLPLLAINGHGARWIHCMNNLKQMGLVLSLYAAENKERFPPIDDTKSR